MPSLRDFQTAVRDIALGHGTPTDLSLWVKDADALSINRNNTQAGLIDVLDSLFPVVARLVGDDFFSMMALDFMRVHPPMQPALLHWGQELPAFLITYKPSQSLPYLADVARLEAAWTIAYHAPEESPIDPNVLTALPQDQLAQALFSVHPSLRLIASPYPVHAIWAANQPDASDDILIDLESGATTVVVARPRADVRIHPVSEGSFAFIMALQCEQSLGVAWDAARVVQSDFSLIQELGAFLSAGLFTEAFLP